MIFVDTGAFIGWFCPNDQHHDASVKIWASLIDSPEKLITSNFILDETITLLGRRTNNSYACDRAEQIYSSDILHVIRVDESQETSALALFRKYSDQGISFTDCVSFSIMNDMSIETVFSFDHHFRIAGFQTT